MIRQHVPVVAGQGAGWSRRALLAAGGPPDQAEIAALRRRHDIHPLTPLMNRPPGR